MRGRAKLGFGVACVCLVVLLVALWRRDDGGGVQARAGARSPSPSGHATHASALPRSATDDGERTALGRSLHYQVRMQTTTENAGTGAPLSMAVELSLAWTRVQEGPDGTLHRATLTEPTFRMTRASQVIDAPIARDLGPELAAAFFVETAPDGRVAGIYVPHGAHPLSNGIRRALAANLQLVVGDAPDAARWEAVEPDQVGEVVAAYTRLDARRVEKKKLRYQTLALGAGTMDLADEASVESAIQYELGADSVIETYRNEEALEVSGLAQPIEMKAEISLRLTRVDTLGVEPVDLSALQFLSLYSVEPSGPPSAEALRQAAGDTPVPELMAELGHTDLTEDRRWELHDQLSARLRIEPQAADGVRAELLAAKGLDRKASMLLASLSDTDIRETQLALLDIGQGAVSEDVRRTALQHLVLAKEPSREMLDGLRGVVSSPDAPAETRAGAMLAYGSAAGEASRSLDPVLRQQGEQDVAALVAGLEAAASPDDEALHLSAVGNSGSGQALPPLVQRYRNGDEAERAAALDAMRLMADPQVDQTVRSSLLDDPSARVRDVAARTASYRPYTEQLERTLLEALTDESDAIVRREMLSVLGQHAHQSNAAAERVRLAAESDASEEVRKHARGLLGLPVDGDAQGG